MVHVSKNTNKWERWEGPHFTFLACSEAGPRQWELPRDAEQESELRSRWKIAGVWTCTLGTEQSCSVTANNVANKTLEVSVQTDDYN